MKYFQPLNQSGHFPVEQLRQANVETKSIAKSIFEYYARAHCICHFEPASAKAASDSASCSLTASTVKRVAWAGLPQVSQPLAHRRKGEAVHGANQLEEKTLVFCATQDHALAVHDLANQMKMSKDPNYGERRYMSDESTLVMSI